jgi:hypothetical protein
VTSPPEYIDILLNRKGFPIKVTVIGHSLLHQSCFHLPWLLGKYRLCDNRRIHLSLQDPVGGQFWRNKSSLGFHGA